MKSYEQMAREAEELKRQGKELDNLVPVRARVAKNPTAVFSIRLSFGEMDQMSKAARKRGITLSEFMRTAAMAAANEELDIGPGEQAAKLEKVRRQVKELAETVGGLQ